MDVKVIPVCKNSQPLVLTQVGSSFSVIPGSISVCGILNCLVGEFPNRDALEAPLNIPDPVEERVSKSLDIMGAARAACVSSYPRIRYK